jgi:hypothetical protein
MAHVRTLILACCLGFLAVVAGATAARADGQLGSVSVSPALAPASPPPSQPNPGALAKVAAQPAIAAGAASAARQPLSAPASTAAQQSASSAPAPLQQPASSAPAPLQQPGSAVAALAPSQAIPQLQAAAKPSSPNSSTAAPTRPATTPAPVQAVPASSVVQTSAAAPPPTATAPLALPPRSPATHLPNAGGPSTNGPPTSQVHSAGGAVSPAKGQAMAPGSGLPGAAGTTSPLRQASMSVGGATRRLANAHLARSPVLPPVASNLPLSPAAAHPLAALEPASAAVRRLPAVTSGVVRQVAPVVESTAPLNAVASVAERAAGSLPPPDIRVAPSKVSLLQLAKPTIAVPDKVTATLLAASGPASGATVMPHSSLPVGSPPGGARQQSVFADQAAARFPSPPHSQVTGATDGVGQLEHAGAGMPALQRSAEADNVPPWPASRLLAGVASPQSTEPAALVADAPGTPPGFAPGPAQRLSVAGLRTPAWGAAERPESDRSTGLTPIIRSAYAPSPAGPSGLPPRSAPAFGGPGTVRSGFLDPGQPLLPYPGSPTPSLPPLWGGNGDAASAGPAFGGAGRGHSAILALLPLLGLLVERRRRWPGALHTSLPSKRPLPTG